MSHVLKGDKEQIYRSKRNTESTPLSLHNKHFSGSPCTTSTSPSASDHHIDVLWHNTGTLHVPAQAPALHYTCTTKLINPRHTLPVHVRNKNQISTTTGTFRSFHVSWFCGQLKSLILANAND